MVQHLPTSRGYESSTYKRSYERHIAHCACRFEKKVKNVRVSTALGRVAESAEVYSGVGMSNRHLEEHQKVMTVLRHSASFNSYVPVFPRVGQKVKTVKSGEMRFWSSLNTSQETRSLAEINSTRPNT